MPNTPVNTANTISTAFRPGEDLRFGPSSSQAIFTFGDYRLEKDSGQDVLSGTPQNLNFTPFSTLDNMGVSDFDPGFTTSVQNNELKPVDSDPYSYSYFGSFYTEVATSINNILDTFPYAMLAFDDYDNNTIIDYSQTFDNTTGKKYSNFKIPANIIINQGFVLFGPGTSANDKVSLMTDTNLFEIQASGTTTDTYTYPIISYSYTGGTTKLLEFNIEGHLFDGTSGSYSGQTTSDIPVYIRPSRKRMTEFNRKISRLERKLLGNGVLEIPDVDDPNSSFRYRVPWPRNIDGFNPDTRGDSFEAYKENILLLAENTDIDKTDIMVKTMLPDNYLDFDSDTKIYKKLTSAYAKEFDEIKQFIDNMAYAHTITYNEENNVPDKFLTKLSNLLGWKLSSAFSEVDLFEYLSSDSNENSNQYAYYNVEIWKRILVNINWLYKKKGTRDALMFVFRLMGAPESLISFNEFTYKVNQTATNIDPNSPINQPSSQKINQRGFPNYDASQYIFQEGGPGRGDGDAYINQWRPEFNPLAQVDNIKVTVGDTAYTGSENIINTKEVCLTLSPAQAIEDDVFNWYQQSGTCWVWGSPEYPYPYAGAFSSLTTPFEWTIDDCEFVNPSEITGMTLNQYLEFIYTSNIDPRNRKTNNQSHTSWTYPELKKIYMNYFLLSDPKSNMLTFKKMEAFLDLMEANFDDYLLQLLPATTILDCQGTSYRNTIFNRQRFVYKEGINQGSEFKKKLPDDIRPCVTPTQVSTAVNDFTNLELKPVVINSDVSQGINTRVNTMSIQAVVNINNIRTDIPAYVVDGEIEPPQTNVTIVQQP